MCLFQEKLFTFPNTLMKNEEPYDILKQVVGGSVTVEGSGVERSMFL